MSGAYTILTLKHVAADKEVSLPIRVNSFTQDTKPKFSSTEVYARMDPIFTYQNTVRTFQITCQTILHGEIVSGRLDKDINSVAKSIVNNFGQTNDLRAYGSLIGGALSSIYQLMYPVFQKERHGVVTTHQLKGPPILQIQVPNVLSPTGGKKGSYIFIPESFSVTSGLADASKVQMTITSPNDMKYLVPVGGYGFTIGGTILHQGDPPGFIYEEATDGSVGVIKFSKDDFPLGTKASYNATKILQSTDEEEN